ncbi:thiamine diphosphokinase [Profundibacterium mesophilum]|uniref:Thiamine diphosphokinase n=1 Tax=Profundibacterium mesophilum KAUST100406-0324 TaxID=1037889 RepID=A0A921NPL4_9RHOB|nr:thiamine diphosphokinase [Profundibacterium mesophilum]KAF0676146.1 thiamine pyrophosphokinase [Profundibacterium mesophilum KAUST100406-0324]
MAKILTSERPVTLVGGGPLDAPELRDSVARAPCIAAADGGAGHVLAADLMPEAVIGDLDSLAPGDAARLPAGRLHHIAEQDSTDFQKCLSRIAAPLVIGVGFSGGRLDHSLAALVALIHAPVPCLLLGAQDVAMHAGAGIALDLPVGARLSVFPMAPVMGRSEGIEWPLDGLRLSPAGRIGTSNRVTGPVRLAFDAPGTIILLERSALDAAIAAVAFSSSGR